MEIAPRNGIFNPHEVTMIDLHDQATMLSSDFFIAITRCDRTNVTVRAIHMEKNDIVSADWMDGNVSRKVYLCIPSGSSETFLHVRESIMESGDGTGEILHVTGRTFIIKNDSIEYLLSIEPGKKLYSRHSTKGYVLALDSMRRICQAIPKA